MEASRDKLNSSTYTIRHTSHKYHSAILASQRSDQPTTTEHKYPSLFTVLEMSGETCNLR